MSGRGPGFVVLYRWRLHPGREEAFIEAWSRITAHYLEKGSLGSRLHRGSDGLFYGYAQWPSDAARQQAFAEAGDPADAEQMRSAVAERFPEIRLESVSDYLVLPGAGETG
ncbi:putative quinol monooxygenase [Polyangium mundeleinium]|uniref:Antibiotic biosynthesis monooxygenase n=1 Tax=Polyangium mundeleinium TaxID=2995306 RepID=A0ABT5F6N2_9BACT|nr:antibiotic biosynthesis monooxygenase [Polyangium mundeleinium]MDC0749766.1 antibiotic biosynthesis monooxygenase [Polyangium mundeleinium]